MISSKAGVHTEYIVTSSALINCAPQNVSMSKHWLTNKINCMCCEGDQQSRHVAALFLKNNFFDLANSIHIHIADVSSSSGGYNYILFKMAMVILLSGHATVPSILIQFIWCHPCKDPGGFCNVVFLFLYPWKITGMHIKLMLVEMFLELIETFPLRNCYVT